MNLIYTKNLICKGLNGSRTCYISRLERILTINPLDLRRKSLTFSFRKPVLVSKIERQRIKAIRFLLQQGLRPACCWKLSLFFADEITIGYTIDRNENGKRDADCVMIFDSKTNQCTCIDLKLRTIEIRNDE